MKYWYRGGDILYLIRKRYWSGEKEYRRLGSSEELV